jgi:ABC-2 type transport system permease protein
MNAYLAIFKLRFVLQLQYRAAALAAFVTNFFFGVVRVMVFQAFYHSGSAFQPLTLEQTVTYTWLTQVTFRLLPWTTDTEMVSLVRSGGVAYELCRPLKLYFSWYCRLLAFRLVPTLLTGLPIYLIIIFLPGDYRAALPASVLAGLVWLISLLLALLLSCALSNLVTISTLWTTAGDGMLRIFPALVMILSGTIVPLAFFPDWMQTILRLLPFAGLADIPFRFYLGIIPTSQIMPVLGLQVLWTVVFVWAGVEILEAGVKRVVIQGG